MAQGVGPEFNPYTVKIKRYCDSVLKKNHYPLEIIY
jgi:hypothetical protein